MARLTGPLFSLDARGAIGRCLVYSFWRGVNYCRRYVIPQNPQSDDQTHVREIFAMGVNAWQLTLSAPDIVEWNTDESAPERMSGFNWHQAEYMDAMLAGTTPPTTPP